MSDRFINTYWDYNNPLTMMFSAMIDAMLYFTVGMASGAFCYALWHDNAKGAVTAGHREATPLDTSSIAIFAYI